MVTTTVNVAGCPRQRDCEVGCVVKTRLPLMIILVPLSVPVTGGSLLTTLYRYAEPEGVAAGMVPVIVPADVPANVPITVGLKKLPLASDI